jgi:hypothetical protein
MQGRTVMVNSTLNIGRGRFHHRDTEFTEEKVKSVVFSIRLIASGIGKNQR